MWSAEWYEREAANGFRSIRAGDIGVSMYHGNVVSSGISTFQGRVWTPMHRRFNPRSEPPPKEVASPSHVFMLLGGPMIAEATTPRGRIGYLSEYMTGRHTLWIWRVEGWSNPTAGLVAKRAEKLAPLDYAYEKIGVHLVDNVFERLTWKPDEQRGWRPLQRFDIADSRFRYVCSGMIGRAAFDVTGVPLCEGVDVGDERPFDIQREMDLARRGRLILHHDRSVVVRSE